MVPLMTNLVSIANTRVTVTQQWTPNPSNSNFIGLSPQRETLPVGNISHGVRHQPRLDYVFRAHY